MPVDISPHIESWKKALLDTTKRNRLIKFVSGRSGGVSLLAPAFEELWSRLVVEGEALEFPWKRELLGLSAAEVDEEPESTSDEAGDRDEGDRFLPYPSASSRTLFDSVARNDWLTAVDSDGEADRTGKSSPQPRSIQEITEKCLECDRLEPRHILTEFTDKKLASHLLRLHRNADEAENDHGVSTLYAAFGFLRWFEDANSQEEIRSPLVLVPVSLKRESIDAPWQLHVEDDEPITNRCLAEFLASQFRVRMPDVSEKGIDTDDLAGLSSYLEQVERLVQKTDRWEVVRETAVGVFNFQKLAMWQDLNENAERIQSHTVCRAIAGDRGASVRPPVGMVAATDLDEKVSPAEAIHILDADSSQHEAIEAIKRGANVVVDGPPGTGKSQTIANAIAELLFAGKKVLFVSEKTAALEVVKRRLDERGLGDFVLELHSNKANKREVAAELGRCVELGPEVYQDVSSELRTLAEDRLRLNAYATELSKPRPPLNITAYQAHGELARLFSLPDQTRWTANDVLERDGDFLRQATDTLVALSRCKAVVENPNAHPWRGCCLTSVTQAGLDDARHYLSRVADATERLSAGSTLHDLETEGPVSSIPQWKSAVNVGRSVLAIPPVPPHWFTSDPAGCAAAALELLSATGRARELVGALKDFDADAIRGIEPQAASRSRRTISGQRQVLAGGQGLTLRHRIVALRDLAGKLRGLAPGIERLAGAFACLLSGLRLSSSAGTVAHAGRFTKLADDLASGVAIPLSWWEPGRRSEILAITTRAAEDQSTIQELRTRLSTSMSPVAFGSENAAIVREARHQGGSFWRRLFGRWKSSKKRVGHWYASSLPDRKRLMLDLAGLDEYHRRVGHLRQVETEYAAELCAESTGKPDWSATAEGLKSVERYEKIKLPANLKSALAPGGGIDRAALKQAARDLARADHEFRLAWAEVLKVYLPAEPDTVLNRPAGEFAAQIAAEADAVEAGLKALENLSSVLRADRDLAAGTWPARASELEEFAGLRGRLQQLSSTLGLSEPMNDIEGIDWSSLSNTAERLRTFLSELGRNPSPATIAALSTADSRDRLKAAIEVSTSVEKDGFEESWHYVVTSLFPQDASISGGIVLRDASIGDVANWSRSRLSDLERLEEWVRFGQVRRDADALGIGVVVDEVCKGQVNIDRAAKAFRRRFLLLWQDALYKRVPELDRFATDIHDATVERFVKNDRLAINTAATRLRSHLLTHPTRPRFDSDAPETSELGTVLREANKKRKHLPVRKLFAEIPNVLPRIKPCLMMSPLAVSTYLKSPDLSFDVVIFDEASQVRPHDAVCAIYRGRQLVVAGDPKQLPPTDFFSRSTDEEAETDEVHEGTSGFESLLDVCLSLGLVRKRLKWHYRSRREGLIAFSNKFFYEGSLVTFPSVDDGSEPAVRFERVQNGVFEDGVNIPEARRVAELVVWHARTSPDRTLGVIAFSQRQQNRILDELEAFRRRHKELESFFKVDRAERFFVKNLENVQGDERDVIIMSVGYGPSPTGRVGMNFGPLNRKGGERRLNVAVTRSRTAMIVTASMTALEVDLSRTKAEGAKLLRAFLDYAERGSAALTEAITSADEGEFDSSFEREVFEELQRRGLKVHKQVGCGGFKIDIAVADPTAGGRYLLGVECDGATYHSAATARDRDRLRQAVLEGLGWRLCRIWSTDWLRNREKQVQRVFAALEAARREPASPPRVEPLVVVSQPVSRVPTPSNPQPSFQSIDDVPELIIRTTALAVLKEYGSTGTEGLCKAIATRLGFKKLGARIKLRIETLIYVLENERKLKQQGDGRWAAR